MALYKVILAYDGTGYAGFQRQAKAKTVQGTVEAALRSIGWQGRTILAAGRTDRGVHASGQVVAFDLEWIHGEGALLSAINANLPDDISALHASQAQPGFHPRKSALKRHYRYSLVCREQRQPLEERYAWRIWPSVAGSELQKVARCFIGAHDFAAFGSPPRPESKTTRTVQTAVWSGNDLRLDFDIEADAFLYHMVRRLVFVMVAFARGKVSKDDLLNSLQTGKELHPTGIAPPNGLVLMGVSYEPSSEVRKLGNELEIIR